MRGLGFTVASSNNSRVKKMTSEGLNENKGLKLESEMMSLECLNESEGEMVESERGVRTNIH
jgi:hypothetical protein